MTIRILPFSVESISNGESEGELGTGGDGLRTSFLFGGIISKN